MGRLAEMQRKLLEVRFTPFSVSEPYLTLVANDGARGYGCCECKPSMVG